MFSEKYVDRKYVNAHDELRNSESEINKIISRWPLQRNLLTGMLYVLSHFITNDSKIIAKQSEATALSNMYQVLKESRNKLESLAESGEKAARDLNYVTRTLNYVDSIEDDRLRTMQSAVFTKLDLDYKDKKRDENYYIIKHTAHNAWSKAISKTVKADGSSLGALPTCSQVGFLFGETSDILIPATVENEKLIMTDLTERYKITPLVFPLNTADLTWGQIAKAVEATEDTAKKFQNALFTLVCNKTTENLQYLLETFQAHRDKYRNSIA